MKKEDKQSKKTIINPNTSLLERYIQNNAHTDFEDVDAKALAQVIKSLLEDGDLSSPNIN